MMENLKKMQRNFKFHLIYKLIAKDKRQELIEAVATYNERINEEYQMLLDLNKLNKTH
nr:hypothetical protein [Mycoplasmopsis bovis]